MTFASCWLRFRRVTLPREEGCEMKLIIDAPQMNGTDLKDIQAALSVASLVWPVVDEHGPHPRSARLTSVEENTGPGGAG